jgi:hypothetical protein
MRQIDRTTGQINPYLFAAAIGLLVLYVTCLVALTVRLPPIHLRACVAAQPEAGEARPR